MTDSGTTDQGTSANAEILTNDPDRVRRILHQRLASLSNCGLSSIPAASGRFSFKIDGGDEPAATVATDTAAEPAKPADSQPTKVATSSAQRNLLVDTTVPGGNGSQPYPPVLPKSERQQQLQILNQQVSNCTRCDQLVANRSRTVFGVGDITPRVVFFGEAPGAEEDRRGEPFVGAAGQLLDKILAASKLPRESVYLMNTVKCRPPSNRNPAEDELSGCWGFASRQLEILQPEFICCLGSVAARTLLGTKQSLGKLRRQFHQYRGSRVIVTYHPAYLLRTPTAKRHVWEDMKLLMKAMGVDL